MVEIVVDNAEEANIVERPKTVRKHIKVLVIDDQPEVCQTISLLLEQQGYQVKCATDANEAVQLSSQESFHIALVDIKMPDIDGIQLVDQLRKIDERMGCIIMTAYPDLETARAAMRAGSRDYVTKPFKRQELLAAVDRICRAMGLVYISEAELNRLIGYRIRQARLSKNLTLRQLSELTELTTSQLSQVELGKNAASLWALARISSALGHQLSSLLRGM